MTLNSDTDVVRTVCPRVRPGSAPTAALQGHRFLYEGFFRVVRDVIITIINIIIITLINNRPSIIIIIITSSRHAISIIIITISRHIIIEGPETYELGVAGWRWGQRTCRCST